jgi:hypothetical protein
LIGVPPHVEIETLGGYCRPSFRDRKNQTGFKSGPHWILDLRHPAPPPCRQPAAPLQFWMLDVGWWMFSNRHDLRLITRPAPINFDFRLVYHRAVTMAPPGYDPASPRLQTGDTTRQPQSGFDRELIYFCF